MARVSRHRRFLRRYERYREQRRMRRVHPVRRFLRVLAGLGVVVGGLLMVPLPGPGWPIVFVGLLILASELRRVAIALDHGEAVAWPRLRALFGELEARGFNASRFVPRWVKVELDPDHPDHADAQRGSMPAREDPPHDAMRRAAGGCGQADALQRAREGNQGEHPGQPRSSSSSRERAM